MSQNEQFCDMEAGMFFHAAFLTERGVKLGLRKHRMTEGGCCACACEIRDN